MYERATAHHKAQVWSYDKISLRRCTLTHRTHSPLQSASLVVRQDLRTPAHTHPPLKLPTAKCKSGRTTRFACAHSPPTQRQSLVVRQDIRMATRAGRVGFEASSDTNTRFPGIKEPMPENLVFV